MGNEGVMTWQNVSDKSPDSVVGRVLKRHRGVIDKLAAYDRGEISEEWMQDQIERIKRESTAGRAGTAPSTTGVPTGTTWTATSVVRETERGDDAVAIATNAELKALREEVADLRKTIDRMGAAIQRIESAVAQPVGYHDVDEFY